MSFRDELAATPDVALAFATALEHQLGEDTVLTVGIPRPAISEILGEEPVRVIAQAFVGETSEHTIALVANLAFASMLEASASDEVLVSACTAALVATGEALGQLTGTALEPEAASETGVESLAAASSDDTIIYPILDRTTPVGCLVILASAIDPASGREQPTPASTSAPAEHARAASDAPLVLAGVEMGVTAELGRTQMTVRELLSISPGAVIDLDRAAGAPVDVLVNGTLIARGEVVVIDEEFGIRISEILRDGAPTR